ncbi:MAG TPA: CDP-alcohol phosphatidyltransferase family protein [Polyangia bacterium]|jgi:phosphatidylglycerophosphate synthase|nr:CDP-alcohol phosphatidyltransferase family protein [Polyangia bacterium]
MFFSDVADAYRRTRKPKDILWNRFVARPLAAVFLVPLARTRITPNQITFLTLVIFAGGAVLLALVPGWRALILGAAILELSYVFDCVDGQLARLKRMSSPVGAHLDFLMDELKAFVLVAAIGARLWLGSGDARFLLEALLGLVAVASAISLTTFVRRPEYAAATGASAGHGAGDYGEGFAADDPAVAPKSWSPLRALESLGKFLAHYPSYILLVAAANRIDLFLHVYVAINAAYAARALLGVTIKLGRSA